MKGGCNHYRDSKVGTPILKKPQRWREKNNVAKGTEAYEKNTGAGWEIRQESGRLHGVLTF
jgi:hypothetical protein